MSHGDPENFDFDALETGPNPEPSPPGGPPESAPAIPLPGPMSKPAPEPPPPSGASSGGSGLATTLAVLLVLGLLGAAGWYFLMGPGAAMTGGEGAAGVAGAPEPGLGPPTTPTTPPEVDTLKADFQALSERLGTLQANLEAMPEPEPPPDLAPLQERLDALGELPGLVQSLSETLTALDERVSAVESTATSAREEAAALRQQVEQLQTATTEPETDAASSRPALAGEELGQVASLFGQRQYDQAQPILQDLRDEFPDDARVWYYSALANGYATGNWEGQTIEFARRGAERERAGTPETSAVDQTFDDLPAQTRTWLDYYRRQAP